MQGPKSKLIKVDIEDKDLEECKECRDACPVTCIKIMDESGKELK
jgi:NAD-dependent dihydropyrimidine dehydrogenase PreA subunit